MTMTKVCNIEPIRAIVYENAIQFVKPCGVKYIEGAMKKEEVHCKKYEDRTCEYMAKKHIEQQQIEEYLLADLGG